jgi:hypothetical protein
VLTDRIEPLIDVEREHRAHAVVEQSIAELKQGPLAHLPSVILSRSVDHGPDLGLCLVDGVLDADGRRLRSAWTDEFRSVPVGRVARPGGAEDRRGALFAEGLGERVA